MIAIFIGISCTDKPSADTLFTSIPSTSSGIYFRNNVTDTDSLNILDYLYYYNGAGLAAGDINNDGLVDLYFVSNLEPNKLYLNKGNLEFEDITAKAGVAGSGEWNTGVNMTDVNGDGYLDIYLSTVGAKLISNGKTIRGKNQLFVNNGDMTFSEKAAEYGLDYEGYSTQVVFFDYDKDGDPDMFLLNHSVHSNENYGDSSIRSKLSAESGDKLFRNDNGHFFDVTSGSGIISSSIGYGLGVAVCDFNHDGWDDIYVSNDFHENDYYYLNNGNGTFSENIRGSFGHTSRFSMGNDVADMNNDGWPDLITTDMLPEGEKELKSSNGDDGLDIYTLKYKYGYYHQYARNAFQLNVARGEYFSDIGLLSGIAATDWTWAPLAADYNNDGHKDLFFSNGILRRLTDLDYIRFYADANLGNSLKNSRKLDKSVIDMLPPGEAQNYMFSGSDSLLFTNQSDAWGFEGKNISTGSVFADLDNDGDLEIVTNNINSEALLYKNMSREKSGNNYLSIHLQSDSSAPFADGTKLYLKIKDSIQYQQLYPARGFMSSSEPVLHFGLNKHEFIDTILVIWPDGTKDSLFQVKANQRLLIRKRKVEITPALKKKTVGGDDFAARTTSVFADITAEIQLNYRHRENDFIDFVRQPLIPHMQSLRGPKLAVADVNKDGLDDFYVCGAKNQPGELFLQTKGGKFISSNEQLFIGDASCEDVDAVFADVDNDGDPDLYVVSGGGEYGKGSSELNDRLYLNDGKGNFVKSAAIPGIRTNKNCIAAADIDADGDIDFFVGAGADEKSYGLVGNSFLLINDGHGKFYVSDSANNRELKSPGIITTALFADMDKDGDPDLLLAGEWMSPVIFENTQGRFSLNHNKLKIPEVPGWWQTLAVSDINGDGFPDILAGNYGRNSKLTADPDRALLMYMIDYDNNGVTEQLIAYRKGDTYYTFLGKDELEHQIPSIKKKYLKYGDFAGKNIREIFGDHLDNAKILRVTSLSSTAFLNDSKGNFSSISFPLLMQTAPVFAILPGDFNRDGKMDLIAAGNFGGVLPFEGRYDALLPSFCEGDGTGNFSRKLPIEKQMVIRGEIRDIKQIRLAGGKNGLIFARNNDSLVFLAW
ncbi:VCBS repeat-containing protein [Pollutibacter soli]|uniref:VCBS repeat-containing protein n=1 Tax=Pollutibacter soli TaxID=3034157 RepID=UPI003013F7DC